MATDIEERVVPFTVCDGKTLTIREISRGDREIRLTVEEFKQLLDWGNKVREQGRI